MTLTISEEIKQIIEKINRETHTQEDGAYNSTWDRQVILVTPRTLAALINAFNAGGGHSDHVPT